MNFMESYYKSGQALPTKERRELYAAILEYYYDGTQPEIKGAALAVFIGIKPNIDNSRARADAGSEGGKQKPSKTQAKAKQAPSKQEANSDQTTKQKASDMDMDMDMERKEPPIPPSGDFTQFSVECLRAMNDILGTCYSQLPPKAARNLFALESKYSVADVMAMIKFKQDEWTGTMFSRNLTPNTLFSPEHFEQYMHQSRSDSSEKSSYDIYD